MLLFNATKIRYLRKKHVIDYMFTHGNIGKKRVKLTIVKVLIVVSSDGTCNNCLFVEVFNYFLNCSNETFDFLASNL